MDGTLVPEPPAAGDETLTLEPPAARDEMLTPEPPAAWGGCCMRQPTPSKMRQPAQS